MNPMAKANETTKAVAPTEKMVKIKIPLERGKANKDVYVSVNDRSWQIKRGMTVEVPECVAEVLQHEEEQLLKAAEYQETMASE
jgi:hypothetical protein